MDGNKIISMKKEKVERGSKFGCWNEDDQWMDVIQLFCYYNKEKNNSGNEFKVECKLIDELNQLWCTQISCDFVISQIIMSKVQLKI